MNYKPLFYFEITKIIIAFLNVIFIAESYPQISILISLFSILTSIVVLTIPGAGIVGAVIALVVVATAIVVGNALVVVATAIAGVVIAMAVALFVFVNGANADYYGNYYEPRKERRRKHE